MTVGGQQGGEQGPGARREGASAPSGVRTRKGPRTSKRTQACAAYAMGSKESHFVLPSLVNAPVDGKKAFLGALVDPYTGPGTNQKKDLHDRGSPPGIDVDGSCT